MGKGQIALEYVTTYGFLLVIVGIMFAYAFINFNESMKRSKADTAVELLAQSADQVYALGPGNVVYVEIDVPQGVQSIEYYGRHVNLRMVTLAGTTDVPAWSRGNLTPGTIDPGQGRKKIRVETVDSNVVFTELS